MTDLFSFFLIEVPRDIDMDIDGQDSEHDEADFRTTRMYINYWIKAQQLTALFYRTAPIRTNGYFLIVKKNINSVFHFKSYNLPSSGVPNRQQLSYYFCW